MNKNINISTSKEKQIDINFKPNNQLVKSISPDKAAKRTNISHILVRDISHMATTKRKEQKQKNC